MGVVMIHKDPLQLSQQELIDHVYELQGNDKITPLENLPITDYLKRLRLLSKVKTNVHSNVSFIKLLDYAEALERKI